MTNKLLSGRVVKGVGGVFTVLANERKYTCFSPKKIRYNQLDVLVGDNVSFQDLGKGKGVIVDVLPRKNKLYRPEIANVDLCFLVLANEPQPDFYLADKVLINCFKQGIEPVIVVNKVDLTMDTFHKVTANYSGIADIITISATTGNVEALKPYLKEKVCCFVGQSAVGKTSILNALLPSINAQVGNLSQKTGRGTHTTRHTSLHKVFDGYLIDTCGFSLCDLDDIRSQDLHLYLDDFVQIGGCKYTSCTHTVEPDCAVMQAVKLGTLNKDRYDRYIEEYNELKQKEQQMY